MTSMPGVAGRDRDLLGAVRVAVEPGLAHEQADRAGRPTPRRSPRTRSRTASISAPAAARDRADAGRAAVLAEHLAQRAGPFADGPARLRERDRRGHEVLGGRRDRAQARERGVDRRVVARRAPLLDRVDVLALDRGIDRDDAAASARSSASGDGSVSVNELTPTTFSSPDSMRRTRSAWLCTSRPFISSIIANEPPPSSTHCSSASRLRAQLGDLALSTTRSLEEVAVLEQVGLVREHLLDAQRPLLVPRRRAGRAPRSSTAAASRAPARPSTSVTPSISSTMRCTLFSGCSSVSPSEFTCMP